MIYDRDNLPRGSIDDVKGIIAAEWRANDQETQMRAVEQFKDCFKNNLDERFAKTLRNYSCFLNQDGQHVFHFSEWTSETLIDNFVCRKDHLFSTSQFEQRLAVTSLWKNVYYPYQSHHEKGKLIQNTGLVVFVKQYFQQAEQTKQWIDMILQTLLTEGDHEGLIQNTYYLNKDGTALLNYARWENETSYNKFLEHPIAETKSNWERIQNFKGWIKEKGVIRRHKQFVNIYHNEAIQ
jgi:hypothetical protein